MVTQSLPVPSRLSTAIADRFGGLPRDFWIVFSGTIANRIGDMVVPFLVFFLGSRGMSTAQTGGIIVALGFGGLAGPAIGGWLADRVGHKFALLLGLIATPASLGILYAAPGAYTLGAAAVLLGLTGKIFPPAAGALIAESVGAKARPKAFSLIHWAVNIGTAGASVTAGFLAAKGFGLLFIIDAVTLLAFAAIVMFGIKPKPRVKQATTKDSGYGVVLRDKLMVAFTGLTIAATVVYAMTEFAIPMSIRMNGLSPAVFGLVAVVNAIGVVTLQPILYGPVSRLGRVKVLAASWALLALGIAATGFATKPWEYAVTAALWTVGEVGTGIVAGGIAADLAPEDARGRYQGAINWAWAAARLIAPILATGLIATVGPVALWWTIAAIGVAAAFAVLKMAPALATRTGRA